MFKLILSEDKMINKNIAKGWSEFNTYGGQRDFSSHIYDLLEKEYRDGRLRPILVAFAICKWDKNKLVLVNGQHGLKLIENLNLTIRAHVERYECFDIGELNDLFSTFDTHGMRNTSHLAKSKAFSLGIDWPSKLRQLVIAGMALRMNKSFNHKKERVNLLDLPEAFKFGNFLKEIIMPDKKITDSKHILRSPVTHAQILTFEKAQEESKKFWIMVRDGDGLKKGTPAWKLRNFLMLKTVSWGRGGGKSEAITYHEMTSKCITAWNAFRKGENTDLKYFSEKPIPKAI